MAAETITVFIDPGQLHAQRMSGNSLCLARMVNDRFSVVWKALPPLVARGYKQQTTLDVATRYLVSHGTVTRHRSGAVTFMRLGLTQEIKPGQTVVLRRRNLYETPLDDGAPGEITIFSQISEDGPHVMLLDKDRRDPIFVDAENTMGVGATTLRLADTFRIWFGSRELERILPRDVGEAAVVKFSDGATNQVISYGADGKWRAGPLA